MKTKMWVLLIGALLFICMGLSIFLLQPGKADFAQVYSDNVLICTLDLHIDQERTVENEFGTNVITVSGGKIAVTQADCPDGYCMKRGFCNGGAQIVCLPNRLVIHLSGQQDVDGITG